MFKSIIEIEILTFYIFILYFLNLLIEVLEWVDIGSFGPLLTAIKTFTIFGLLHLLENCRNYIFFILLVPDFGNGRQLFSSFYLLLNVCVVVQFILHNFLFDSIYFRK